MSAPSPPSTVTGIGPVKPDARVDGVGAAEGGDGHVVERGLVAGHRDAPEGPSTTTLPAVEPTLMSSAWSVPWAITVSAAPSPSPSKPVRSTLVASRSVPVRSPTVMVSAAAEGADRRALDAVEVHRDGGDVAGQAHARAVGRDVDVLADVGAVEGQRVLAALAFDGVAAVAGIPLEGVVAGAELGGVGADVAVDEVVAGAADEGLGAVGAGERVVAGAAVDGDVLEGGSRVLDADGVVAAAGVDGDGRERGAVEARDELAVDDHVERRWTGRQHAACRRPRRR